MIYTLSRNTWPPSGHSLDPNKKCLEIISSTNVENVIPKVVALVIEQLRNTTPIYGIDCARQVSNKAGANWIAARDMVATLSI